MYSLSIDIRVTIIVQDPYPPCTGDATVILGEYGTRREMMCNKSSRLHRLGPFCTRFKLSPLEFNSDGLTNGIFNLVSPFVQPRPWDAADPYYPRAVAVWDAQAAYKKAQPFSLLLNGNIPAGGVFTEFKDGEMAGIYTSEIIGVAILTIQNL